MEIEVGEAHVWIWRDADIGHGNGDAAHLANLATRKVVGRRAAVRVLVAAKPVDFHKGAEGLAALVRETMPIPSTARFTYFIELSVGD